MYIPNPGRRGRRIATLLVWLVGWAMLITSTVYAQPDGAVYVMEVSGVINPPVADYIGRVLDDAAEHNARLVVIRLDTPGGLDASTRVINQAILASPVPVATFVTPSGARAASAGLFILMASHVAAMSPGTNTGAAHPVALGGGETDEVMTAKVVNDAAATIRSLAMERGRNAEWAEQAVRESVSVTAAEALSLDVIDVVASDIDDLLAEIDGTTVQTSVGEVTLDVEGAPLYEAPMSPGEQFLHVISNPDIAFILLSVGSIGLIAELYNPGALFPGVTGAIALILAFFSLGNLPTNWAGVALVVFAIVLFVAELATEGTGVLGVGAVVSFVLGGLILFRPFTVPSPAVPVLRVSPWLLGATTAVIGGLVFLVLTQLVRARRAPLRTGQESFLGQVARVHQDLNPRGRVWFEGQPWYAELPSGQQASIGEQVRIVGIEGLTLMVERIGGKETAAGDAK